MNKRAVREGDNVRIKSLFIIYFTLKWAFYFYFVFVSRNTCVFHYLILS